MNTISPASISNRLPPLGGGLVKAEWFKRYRENERPERFDRIMQSWDTANKASELSDFSVCTTWGVSGKNLFLLGLFRRRLEYPAFKRAVREQESQFASPGSTRSAFWAAAPAPRSSAGSKMPPAALAAGSTRSPYLACSPPSSPPSAYARRPLRSRSNLLELPPTDPVRSNPASGGRPR